MREVGNRRVMWTAAWSVVVFLYVPILVMAVFSFNDSVDGVQEFLA